MTLQPLIGGGGYAGWRLLTRTMDAQKTIIAREPAVARDVAAVRERLAKVSSAEQLIGDRALLRTTLSAYGLEADVGKKAFLQKVLESDPDDPKSFVNRLSDKRYRAMVDALDFSAGPKRPASLVAEVEARHLDAELERRVGTADGNLRLALNARRELPALAARGSTDKAKWYAAIGSLPLRKVLEGALGLSASFAKLPVDRQVSEMQAGLAKLTGTREISGLSDPARVEKIVQMFLIRSGATTSTQSSYSAALTLLGG